MKPEQGSIFFPGDFAMQSSLPARPFHVAIIMDGNGRWATARGRPREFGHRQGVKTVRRVVEGAPAAGIDMLTLYAFSSDNWRRPAREVRALMSLFRRYLRSETPDLQAKGVRLQVIGRRDRLPATVVRGIEEAERATAGGRKLLLRLAVDYSARHALAEAARLCAAGGNLVRPTDPAADAARAGGADGLDPERFAEALGQAIHGSAEGAPDVDLLIRTGGEQRLSDFLLWECAYAELVFTPRMWPDFGAEDLSHAISEFMRRDRRFGGVAAAV
jgi:undecaprenyl diphosphate synthase